MLELHLRICDTVYAYIRILDIIYSGRNLSPEHALLKTTDKVFLTIFIDFLFVVSQDS